MYPVLIRIYGIPIFSYGFFLALAFFVCLILILRRSVSKNILPHLILDLYIYIIISGIIGARLLYVVLNLDYYIMHPIEVILLNKGGLVFYGGFVSALITGILFAKRHKLQILDMADLFIMYLPVGQAIGRIGCFLNGCCYGRPAKSIFGVQFPEYSFPAKQFGQDVLVHPVQIYSSLADIIIFLILAISSKYKKFSGQVVLYYMILYGLGRFFLEYFRVDNPEVFYGLNLPQIISIFIILIALILSIIKICRNTISQ